MSPCPLPPISSSPFVFSLGAAVRFRSSDEGELLCNQEIIWLVFQAISHPGEDMFVPRQFKDFRAFYGIGTGQQKSGGADEASEPTTSQY